MNEACKSIFSCAAFFILVAPLRAQETVEPYAIKKNAIVIDGKGGIPLENPTVVVQNVKISCVGDFIFEDDIDFIDVKGNFLIAGLIDSYIHYCANGWLN